VALERIQRFNLSGKGWEDVPVLRPIPNGNDPWGVLAPLKGTDFEGLLPVVSGEVWSHALHGHLAPLMRQIGRPPDALFRFIPQSFLKCAESKTCGTHDLKICLPGPKTPNCWIPFGVDAGVAPAIIEIVLAWRDGRHVVIVAGEEFL
jgi:hypothetical protein